MEKKVRPAKIVVYRTGEVIFLLLVAFYFTGGLGFLPASWIAVFDATPKIHRKLLTFAAGAAVILGLALFERARRDKAIESRNLLVRVIETWKSASTLWIVGFFLLFGSWWTISSCLRYEALNSGFDMAIFTQAIWNTTQGAWFYSSIKGGINLLGDHFAPLLAAFAIPYKLWPDPDLLLAVQAFAAAACVFPLTRIVRKSGQSPSWAVLYCLAFALYLPVRNAVRFDFHPEVAAMPLLFWAFVFLDEKKTVRASLFLALALLAKENMATVAFAFGFYACVKKEKAFGFGAFWMVFSVIYFFVVTRILIPELSGAPYFYLDGNFTSWIREGWGPFVKHIFRLSTLDYLAKVYSPLAFTSILAPASFLLTLPTLAQNILSRNEMTRSVFFQYTATLTPFVFISSVVALSKVRSHRRYWAYGILLTSVLMSGVSEVYPIRRHWITITPHVALVKNALAGIPSTASLRTHEFYAPHAANRKELHIYENDHPKEGGSWKARHTDFVAIDRRLFKDGFDVALNALKRDGYQIDLEEDGFCILKRSPSAD
jgi:uncharacterized membrane protein